jgi:6-phosphogluconolactonase (cycloisomerase 2 family)
LSYPELGDELGRGVYFEALPELAAGHGTTWSVSSGSLPAGLTLDPSTGVISGVPSTFGAASFDVTVEDCASATTFTALATVVVVPYARGLCATDATDGTLASFRRTHATGVLAHNGARFHAAGVQQIAMHPWGRLAFVAAGNAVASYRVDSRDLELGTELDSATLGGTVRDLAVAHDGRFLFATTSSDRVYALVIDTSDGSLTPASAAFDTTGDDPRQIAVGLDDALLYVACHGDDRLETFAIDPVDGSLAWLDATAAGDGVRALALTDAGDRLYAGSEFDTQLHGYSVDAITGLLTAAAWSPFDISTDAHVSLAISPDDLHLYVGFDDAIAAFDLDAGTGAPTAMVPATVDGPSNARQLAIEPRGGHLYSVHDGGMLRCWDIDAGTGALTPAAISTLLAGPDTFEIGIVRGHARLRIATRGVYATSQTDDGVYEYDFAATTGTLTDLPATPFGTGTDPQTVSVHPFDEFALVAHQTAVGNNGVSVHAIDASGLLQVGAGFSSASANAGAQFDRSGRTAYRARGSAGSAHLTSYAFDSATGALDALASTAFAADPWPPAVHPGGRLVVVPDSLGEQVELFTADAQSGVAAHLASISTGGVDPFRAVFDGTGRFLFVAHLGSDSLAVFEVDLTTPTLTALAGSPFATGITPLVMAMSRDGAALMIADTLAGAWESYVIDLDAASATLDGTPTLDGSGAQLGMALLRFDASGSQLLWVDSIALQLNCSPITAPGVLGAPTSSVPIGAQITSMDMRDR